MLPNVTTLLGSNTYPSKLFVRTNWIASCNALLPLMMLDCILNVATIKQCHFVLHLFENIYGSWVATSKTRSIWNCACFKLAITINGKLFRKTVTNEIWSSILTLFKIYYSYILAPCLFCAFHLGFLVTQGVKKNAVGTDRWFVGYIIASSKRARYAQYT